MARFTESSVKGNSWSEQEAAFFGKSPSKPPKDARNRKPVPNRTKKKRNEDKMSASYGPSFGVIARTGVKALSKHLGRATAPYPAQVRQQLRQHAAPPPRPQPQPHPHPPPLPRAQNDQNGSLYDTNWERANTSARRPFPSLLPSPPMCPLPPPSDVVNNRGRSGDIGSLLTSKFPQLPSLRRHLAGIIPSCIVCGKLGPSPYKYQPFFPHEKVCADHADVGECCGCHRFEPSPSVMKCPSQEFSDLQDNNRKLCPACLRSVIVDTADAGPVWSSVLMYFDHVLGMFRNVPDVRRQMDQIPILIVGHDGLNDPCVRGSGHEGGNTRGLCMYEYSYHPMGGGLKNMLQRNSNTVNSSRSRQLFSSVLNFVSDGLTSSKVSAILCLKGLPRDLMASILAHEGTHAWFKLNPHFNPQAQMPLQVEEGCCQLMAYLYLTHLEELDGADGPDYGDDGQPTDKKLRQFFRYCIETDTSETYGEGFRLAAAAHAKLNSVPALLEYVAEHRCFPP